MTIRNEYRFSRPLAADEAEMLLTLISWRAGAFVTIAAERAVGCVAHPDDVDVFEERVRTRGLNVEPLLVKR